MDLYKKLGKNYDQYMENKRVWETAEDKNSEAAQVASKSNQWLRDKYGIANDTYSYQELLNNRPYQGNAYTEKANTTFEKLGAYDKYTDPWKDRTSQLYNSLSSFSYNPDADPTYNAYKDMYERQGKSAERSTLSNLTAISGGRNNSWASAAASGVRQAYAQKTSDMIPQLAQQAYNKLLQEYQLAQQMSDKDYSRWNDEYNRQTQLGQLYNNMGQQEMQNMRQQNMDNRYYRQDDINYDNMVLQNQLDRQYLPQERELAWQSGNIKNKYLEEQILSDLRMGKISEERALLEIDMLKNPQKYASFSSSSKGGGGRSSGSSKGTSSSMTKTAAKNFINQNFTYDGVVNKLEVLDYLYKYNVDDDTANKLMEAAGITKGDLSYYEDLISYDGMTPNEVAYRKMRR